MASRIGKRSSLAHLWQAPLLLISLGLFGYAAYLFVDPQPGLTIDQKIDVARVYLKNERPEAAIEQLNRLLTTEKLPRENEATIHLMLAEGIEAAQRQKRINIPANHARIIEQTQIALAQGLKPTAEMHRRLGESYEALDRPSDALSHFRHAIAMNPSHALRLQRKVIAMQAAQDDPHPAEASIDDYLASNELTDSERAWALGEKAQLLADRGEFVQARELLAKAIRLDNDPIAQGQVNYRLGYCAWKLGANEEAERYLRVARDQLRVQHPLDGEAAYVLGKIFQDRNDAAQANSFYQVVLVSHPGNRVAPLAKLGRGVCRILQGEDDAGLTDLHDLVEHIGSKPSREKLKTDTLAGLRQAADVLTAKQNYQGALEVLAYEQQLQPEPPATFFARLATVYEKRAEQIDRTIADAAPVERVRRTQSVHDYRTKAGDAYVAYSRMLTLADDKGYGEALWRGIDLYDRAPNLQCVVSALELFVVERPDDSLTPDALLRLGNAYRAAGQFDKAIESYKRNQFRYPNTLAASKSGVPLAQAYIAKGPDDYQKAELVLIQVVDNNPLLTPEAEEFRMALFELAQLYYRTGRFEEAVGRFEEITQRYPKDEKLGQLLFLIGDSYRKSAGLLDARLASAADAKASTGGAAEAAEALAAKRDRLAKARGLYDQSIEFYRVTPPSRENDKLYQKLSHFYRADCAYDLGSYDEAIRLYDAAAFRYQDDPSALAAYVQIVNSYCALGKIEEAKTANERAKWLLRRMPSESFADGGFTMPKAYWEQWLKWTSAAGMW
ncbi:MAG: tetratricopeptide repeat protein [Tepidisphaeraceae bacterium]